MAATWSWLARRREREVIGHCLEHLKLIEEECKELISELKCVIKGEFDCAEEHYAKVFSLERQADELKLSLLKSLSSGVIHPISREELVRLILTADDIGTNLKMAGMRLRLVRTGRLPRELLELYLRMAEKVLEQIRLLGEAIRLLAREPERAVEVAEKVERLEEEVDEIELEGERRIMRFCDESKPSDCLLAHYILDSIEESSDNCEDVGDVIRSIALAS